MHPRDRLIFALDVNSSDQAMRLVEQLCGHVGCFKIGLELFVSAGPLLVRQIANQAPVFLDLKLHDIPATVAGAAQVANTLGVSYLTVHVDEGGRALKAAVDAAPQVGILGVTVLTSISNEDLSLSGFALSLEELVRLRAISARDSGCRGIICSGQEAESIRPLVGTQMLIITPGVRPAGEAASDQKRVVTPAQAIKSGADMIVVGRPIRDAENPALAADKIVEQIAAVGA